MTKSEKNELKKSTVDIKNKNENNDKKVTEETTEEKLEATQEKLLRTMAEMENQRRRFEKEKKEAFEFGGFNFAAETLSLIDNIDRAITSFKNDDSLKNNKDLNKFIENIDIIERDLASIFEKNNIKKIETENKKFDPNIHQAMTEIEDNSVETGVILQEMQAGYMLGTRLLRPALVGVAKKKDVKNEENNEKKEKK